MAMKMREMEQVSASTVQREINLGMKERHVEQLAEDYRLEIHEMKAKLTNSSFQGSDIWLLSFLLGSAPCTD